MAAFNLTAQLQLQAPTNTSQVVSDIRKQLSGITANVQVKGNPQQLAKVNKQLQGVNKSAASSAKSVSNLNRNLSEAARRFSVITVATGTMLALARAIKNAVGDAIAFERELIKISQVTGKTVSQLSGLTDEVTRLSVSLGASSADLLNVSRVLAQAGFTAQKTKQALEILAQTSLGATFDSIQDTTEGAIAVLRQFGEEAKRVGGDIKFLEQTMDAINSVSKKFAVESGDLITVIRRVGGVFASAGGEVNELIALFTSVRATTRESAETIATGLRTIFTRIQRTDTVDQLAALGIQLRDSEGQFLGAFEAVKRLSAGLGSLDPRDYRFSEIVESLGGFRQVGKVIPLIRQFTIAQDALNVAQSASGSTARDAATAQQSLQVQAQKVTQDFKALIRTLADSSTFRSIANGALQMATAFIKVVEAIKPLLPLITSLIALKIGSALAPGLGALVGIGGRPRGKNQGGKIHKFASGGFVPGTGNRDTVPAMMTPGEFVIKKSSAQKMGASALESMNNNRYAKGGLVLNQLDSSMFAGLFAKPKGKKNTSGKLIGIPARNKDPDNVLATVGSPASYFISSADEEVFNKKAEKMLETGITGITRSLLSTGVKMGGSDKQRGGKRDSFSGGTLAGPKQMKSILNSIGSSDIAGKIFEGVTRLIIGDFRTSKKGAQAGFDIPRKSDKRKALSGLFNAGSTLPDIDYDNKLTASPKNRQSLLAKALNDKEINDKTTQSTLTTFTGDGKNLSLKQLLQQQVTETSKGYAETRINELNAARESIASKGFDKDTEKIVVKKLVADVKKLRDYTKKRRVSLGGKKAASAKQGVQAKAAGGMIDSVPALLTPGEFVVKKSSAQSIGYNSLNKMNQTGVQKFEAGGIVNTRRHAYGRGAQKKPKKGQTPSGGEGITTPIPNVKQLSQGITQLGGSTQEAAAVMSVYVDALSTGSDRTQALAKGLESTGSSLKLVEVEALAAAQALEDTIGVTKKGEVKKNSPKKSADVATLRGGLEVDEIAPAAKRRDQEKIDDVRTQFDADQAVKRQKGAGLARKQLAQGAGLSATGVKAGVKPNAKNEKAYRQAMAVYTKKIKEGANQQEALTAAQKDLDESTDKLSKETAAKQKAAKEAGAAKQAKKEKKGEARQKTLGKLQSTAQSAQSAAFFATAALTAGIQMSNFSDVTKQAATETIAFGAALVAGGSTAIDMLANLAIVGKAAAASEVLETGANTSSTVSEGAETIGDTAEAAASSAAALPLIVLAAVVLGVVLVFKYLSAQAKAQADAIAKERKASLDRLSKGEGAGGDLESAKAGVGKELEFRDEADKFSGASTAAIVGGGVAGAIALGAALGSTVPVLGTVVGALVGLGVGLIYYNSTVSEATQKEQDARQKQVDSILGSIDAIDRLGTAGKKFDDAMSDLDKFKLPDTKAGKTQRVVQELDIANELGSEIQKSNVGAEFGKLGELASTAGKTIGQLTEKDFEDDAAGLIAFQTAQASTTVGLEQLTKRSKQAAQTLQKAAELEIKGDMSFQELKQQGGLFAQALEASKNAIQAEAQARLDSAAADEKAAKDRLDAYYKDPMFDPAKEKAAKDDIKTAQDAQKRIKERTAKSIAAQDQAAKMQVQAAQERVAADKRAAAAADVLRRSLAQTAEFLGALNDIKFDQEQRGKALGNQKSLLSGGNLDFSQSGPQGLGGDVTLISDLKQFSEEVLNSINDFPPGLRAEAKRQLAIVRQASQVFSTGRDRVLDNFGPGSIKKGTKFGPKQQEAIIRAAGLDPDKLDDKVLEQIMAQIEEKAADGITPAEFDEIFGPFKAEADAAMSNLQQLQERRNQELQLYGAYLDNLQAKRDQQIKSIQGFLTVAKSNAELLAKARGGEVGIAEKQATRVSAAQTALSGTGVRAGDVRGASQSLKMAKERRAALAEEIKNRKASGQSIMGQMALDRKLQDIIKKTTAELNRLANQSELAADIMGEIDKEREKSKERREVITGLITDFVVGGKDQRRGMIEANAGIIKAVQTGTLQNQTEEQRSATVGLLDKLANIAIPAAGGLTGKEVKQELVFRDAIRMGLDPDVARQLATATSKEEQLIKALERLTFVMAAAAGGAAAAGLASGGLVQYRADGGNIFQPRGTDTVPAMLTPGEFVIKKSSVDKIGRGNLAALNNGYARGGLVQYRQGGGAINPLNAMFAGAQENNPDFKVPTGDQIKELFYQGVQSDFGGFLKLLQSDGDQPKKIIQNLIKLKAAGKLNVRKLRIPDRLASTFSTFVNSSDIFASANEDGVSLRPPLHLAPLFSGQGIDYQLAEGLMPQLQTYVQKLQKLQPFKESEYPSANVTGKVINKAFGFNPAFRAAALTATAKGKADQLLGSYIGLATQIRQKKLEAQRSPGQQIPQGPQRLIRTGGFGRTQLINQEGMENIRGGDRLKPKGAPISERIKKILQELDEAGVLRLAQGGGVPGTDTVPAMLTPGEFVMNKAAVAQHGVGYMKSLNRGRIPGFNRGGVVGRGGVQYKKDGGGVGGGDGVLSIDPSAMQNVLTTFNTNFSLTLDKITGPFKNISLALLEVAKSFERVEFHHEFRGELGLSVNIGNKDAIIAAVSEGIEPSIAKLIEEKINQKEKDLRGGI